MEDNQIVLTQQEINDNYNMEFEEKNQIILTQEKYNNEIIEFEENNEIFNDKINLYLEQLYNSDWFKTRPEKIQQVYKDFPFHKFYKLKNCDKPVRIYGFNEENSESGLITALTLVPSLEDEKCVSTKNYMLSSFEKIDKWSENDIELIELYTELDNNLHIVFRHPFGYEHII